MCFGSTSDLVCDSFLFVSFFFFSSRRRHTRSLCDWSSDVCSSDLCGARICLGRGRPVHPGGAEGRVDRAGEDRKSTRLNSSHTVISYAVFCLKKKKKTKEITNNMIEVGRKCLKTDNVALR